MFHTRYLGLICYSLISALVIAKDIVGSIEGTIGLLAPIAGFITVDLYKYRNQTTK